MKTILKKRDITRLVSPVVHKTEIYERFVNFASFEDAENFVNDLLSRCEGITEAYISNSFRQVRNRYVVSGKPLSVSKSDLFTVEFRLNPTVKSRSSTKTALTACLKRHVHKIHGV